MNKKEFIKYTADFLEYLKNEQRLALNTLKSYYLDLQQIESFWNTREAQEQKPLILEQILHQFPASLSESVSSSSLARKISCINSFKRFLKGCGIMLEVTLKRPIFAVKTPEAIDQKTLFNLLDAIEKEDLPTHHPLRDKAIIELLYATGLRCSELASIELKHINFKDKYIIVRSPRKKERIVYFGSKAHAMVINYLHYERAAATTDHEKLFLSYKKAPLAVRSIQRICAMFRLFLKADIVLTPHTLRHTFATHMLEQGAEIELIQELLGHKRKATTEKYLKITKTQIIIKT